MRETGCFAVEQVHFERHRAAWVVAGREGWWVAIQGDVIVGPHEVYGQARAAALAEFGRLGFMLRRIRREDRPIRGPSTGWTQSAPT